MNKIDVPKVETLIFPFHQFGVENVYAVSAEHSLGLEDLVSDLAARLPESTPATPQEEIRVALIGRPNMGKSSLLNQLVGSERSIVTEIPGTTRDAVDTILSSDGTVYRLIDTAGIRRKGKTRGLAEKMGVVMARKSIDRSDVVLLLIDATEGATKLDATVGGYAHEAGKSLIVVVNKWDLIEKDTYTQQALETEFRRRMRFLDHAPMVFVSAKTGQRVMKLLEFVKEASSARKLRVPTGTLNRLVQEKIRPRIPSAGEDRHPLLYVAQVRIAPPTFVLFTRSRKRLHFSVERYFSNQLRAEYGFYATPIRIFQRNRGRRAALSQG